MLFTSKRVKRPRSYIVLRMRENDGARTLKPYRIIENRDFGVYDENEDRKLHIHGDVATLLLSTITTKNGASGFRTNERKPIFHWLDIEKVAVVLSSHYIVLTCIWGPVENSTKHLVLVPSLEGPPPDPVDSHVALKPPKYPYCRVRFLSVLNYPCMEGSSPKWYRLLLDMPAS